MSSTLTVVLEPAKETAWGEACGLYREGWCGGSGDRGQTVHRRAHGACGVKGRAHRRYRPNYRAQLPTATSGWGELQRAGIHLSGEQTGIFGENAPGISVPPPPTDTKRGRG